ncbi:MAG: DUF1254 domain-containing protein [Chthonomonadaceae bacterium]|nr:DUF1254 domain-containing protein [Chthonomonadaceae bacterium]
MSESLLDARSLFLTPNTSTVYAMLDFDVKDGPVVIDVPAGVPIALAARLGQLGWPDPQGPICQAECAGHCPGTPTGHAPAEKSPRALGRLIRGRLPLGSHPKS